MHAEGSGVLSATVSVDHEFLDQLKELRLFILAWKLCRQKAVDVLWDMELVFMMKEDDHMDVRKTMLHSPDCRHVLLYDQGSHFYGCH